ncbi:hypothetical protein YC2023_040226 [Brassica napus]
MEQRDKFLELETGIDQDLMAPLTDLEIAEVDNLVLETERLEMAENTIDENMIDIDNDDLLGDSPDLDAEKIEAISQLSPANAVYKESAAIGQHLALAKATATSQEPAQKNLSDAYNTTILSENATIRSENATILAELASQKKFNTEIMQKLDRLMSSSSS